MEKEWQSILTLDKEELKTNTIRFDTRDFHYIITDKHEIKKTPNENDIYTLDEIIIAINLLYTNSGGAKE